MSESGAKIELCEGDYDPEVENNEFYFESDHLALRTNQDYRKMLKYIVTLECHKIMMIKDIENLHKIKKSALAEPLEFVDKLKNGLIDFPPAYSIPETPTIDWSKYGIAEINFTPKEKTSDSEQESSSNILIRGRVYNESKPQTFNQLWTCEEQKRLEELLTQFPDEEIEMRRWSKIADALGNRTPKQVMSRVQKYFLKLQRAGLPIPGRYRRGVKSKARTATNLRHQRYKVLQKRSTFFPAQNVPVLMEENQLDSQADVEYKVSTQWTPIELMKAVYERRKIEEMSDGPLPVHTGISCTSCKTQNIVGTCWTDGIGSNWCSDCLVEYQPSTKMIPRVMDIS